MHQITRRHITDDNNLLNGTFDHYYSLKSRSSEVNFISCLGNHYTLFRRFREAAKFVISVRLSVCPSTQLHGTTLLPKGGFSLNFVFEYFSKICPENSSIFKISQEQRLLNMKTLVHL